MDESQEWTINYLPDEGGRFTGKLLVADEGVTFRSLYESSNSTVVKAIFLDVTSFAAAGGHTVYRYSNDDEAVVSLPFEEISGVEATKKGFMKRAVITMKNGERFTFDYGMLSVKSLVARVEALIAH
jgi:hypothetical protein